MGIYNREEAMKFLGAACINLNILRNRDYKINVNDFDGLVHKMIFGALQNLALEKDIETANEFIIESYLRQFPKYEVFKSKEGLKTLEACIQMGEGISVDYAYRTIKKFSLLNRYLDVGIDIRDLYDFDTVDIKKFEEQRLKLDKLSLSEIKNHFKNKMIEIDESFKEDTDKYHFMGGRNLKELLSRCKTSQNWGTSFQSGLFNAVFKGMLGSKFMIRSAGTGGSKTRQSIGDLSNISVSERYIPEQKKWIKNENIQDTLLISTELTEDEINLALLATVAGVSEEIIKEGRYTPDVETRLEKAIDILENSKIHCEYNSNFNLSELENMIEKHIIRHNIKHIFFDYIQITANLSKELTELFGYVLREDQMLNQLSTCLKNLANKYDVFILSSTQLNRNYKYDGYIDVTHLRGGMATADKADYVVITMKTSKADIEKLEPILEEGFKNHPTHAHHICKNRGGKWSGVIIWTKTDLDTINVVDCFVTTQDFELVHTIVPVILR